MSFQQQQGFVYPNTATSSSNPSPSSHSSGSFGSVFIVLAVIVALSAVACFLRGGRRHHHRSPKLSHQHMPPVPQPERREPKQGHHGNFNDRGVGDIEFGFGKKQFGNGEVGKGVKGKPSVRFEFRGDPRGGGGERDLKGGEFSAI